MGISLRETVMKSAAVGRMAKMQSQIKPADRPVAFPRLFDTRVDYESLKKALGSIMGSGGMVVMDNRVSMVEIARFFMEFCMSNLAANASLPGCAAHIYRLLNKFMNGEATAADLKRLEDFAKIVKDNSPADWVRGFSTRCWARCDFPRRLSGAHQRTETETASVD